MAINSKKKGSRFERVISKWFSDWSGFKFERNRAGSGAWHSNKDAGADITCTDEKHAHRCKVSIECKSYKDIRFEHILLDNKKCDILKFWVQAWTDANRTKKIPMLCMRYNSMPRNEFFIVVDGKLAEVFLSNSSDMHVMDIKSPLLKNNRIYVFRATEVFKNVSYRAIHKQAKDICRTMYKV